MSTRDLASRPAQRTAVLVLLVAAALLAWSINGAVRAAGAADRAPSDGAGVGTLAVAVHSPPADIGAAVDLDLFQENRSAPKIRYRMPGEPADDSLADPAKPVVLGTA